MDLSANAALAALAGLLIVNYVVTRTQLARDRAWLFWGISVLDAAAAVAVLTTGVPGVEGRPLVRVMVALVILLHLAQNFQIKSGWDAERRAARLDAEYRERQRIHEEG